MGTVVNVERLKLSGGEVSFNARGGEVTVLLSREKETLTQVLRAVSGEDRREGVVFSGENVSSLAPSMRRAVLISSELSSKKKWSLLRSFEFFLKGYGFNDGREKVLEALHRAEIKDVNKKICDVKEEDFLKAALFLAAALNPSVILLDKPLSVVKDRREALHFIKSFNRTFPATMLYAAESVEEALIIADTLVVLREAKLEQSAPPERVYERPYTGYVASLVGGACFLKARVYHSPSVRTRWGYEFRAIGMRKDIMSGTPVVLAVKKEDVVLSDVERGFRARVDRKEYRGSYTDYELSLVYTGEKLLYRAYVVNGERSLAEGEEAFFSLKEGRVNVFNADKSRSLMDSLSRYS